MAIPLHSPGCLQRVRRMRKKETEARFCCKEEKIYSPFLDNLYIQHLAKTFFLGGAGLWFLPADQKSQIPASSWIQEWWTGG